MAGAVYFTAPLRELTNATNQISKGNFETRISEKHPDEFAEIARAFNTMATGLQEGGMLRNFVAESVRREISDQTIDELAQKSQLRRATIIFAGICDFNSYQRNHDEHETFALLQKLLQVSDNATSIFGGEIDKVIEDKIMIVFEHENDDQPFCEKAIMTAINISEQMWAQAGYRVAAGVNTGITVAGIMGAANARLSRTVVGDPVNLAARLTSLATKLPEGGVIVSGALVSAVPHGYECEKLPVSSVKGKTQAIEAYLVKSLS
ncbi:MAG: adenylate/guanylate cyclase domain-containing protein [Candidatus Riflebacteria bacterium]|nr:adenylate/guanylate cyclase domain-containing protein [Candidatus Riflebacteria bacterium]